VDNSVLVVGVLMTTVLLRVALVAVAVWFLIPRRRLCPHCAEETAALESPRMLTVAQVQRRWCLSCGWVGLSRRPIAVGRRAVASQPSARSTP
jgi:hypothetical protein